MCVLATKHLRDYGWVIGKCRDRSYKPSIHIKQSFRRNVERCYIKDEKTGWTEGVNEYGIAICNTTMLVKSDTKEGDKADHTNKTFSSPGGKAIRTALFEKTPKAALNKLIELEMEGFTAIITKDEAYLLEAPHYVDEDIDSAYEYKYVKLDKTKTYVRTNHGILFPDAGYPIESDDKKIVASRKSSESRYEIVHKAMAKVKEPMDILKALSQQPNKKDPQMNPLRVSKTHGKKIMVTTGQILLIPSEHTLHYRSIWGTVLANFEKLNSIKTKTWFEIISSRTLLSVKESVGTFKEFWNRS